MRPTVLLPCLAVAASLAACTSAPSLPCPEQPPAREEPIPKPPVSAAPLIWQPGHWDWNGSTYNWQSGLWVQRTNQSGEFMPGFWGQPTQGGACVWNPAHWM